VTNTLAYWDTLFNYSWLTFIIRAKLINTILPFSLIQRLRWMCQAVKNTLAYYVTGLITVVKCFIMQVGKIERVESGK
jgi:hypothetical protein